jgi:predicted secreted protein
MSKNYSGREYTLWVSASAPATADESASYTQVGLVTDLNLSISRNAIETSNKDDGDSSSFIAGRRNWTADVTAIYDHTSNAGQAIFTTAMNASNGTVYFLFSNGPASADQEFHGSAVITALNFGFPDEETSSVNVTLQGTGALTEVAGT